MLGGTLTHEDAAIEQVSLLNMVPSLGEDMSHVWSPVADKDTDLLLIYSDGSPAWDVYETVHMKHVTGILGAARASVELFENCDHLFTLVQNQDRLIETVCSWLRSKEWTTGSAACSSGSAGPNRASVAI